MLTEISLRSEIEINTSDAEQVQQAKTIMNESIVSNTKENMSIIS